MNVASVSRESKPVVMSQSKRVMGMVENRRVLERLALALEPLGVADIEFLEGGTGEDYLDQWKHSFAGLVDSMFGDLESEMRGRYAKGIQEGRLVFAVPTTDDNARKVVSAVRACGASDVASFGTLINESYETPTEPVV